MITPKHIRVENIQEIRGCSFVEAWPAYYTGVCVKVIGEMFPGVPVEGETIEPVKNNGGTVIVITDINDKVYRFSLDDLGFVEIDAELEVLLEQINSAINAVDSYWDYCQLPANAAIIAEKKAKEQAEREAVAKRRAAGEISFVLTDVVHVGDIVQRNGRNYEVIEAEGFEVDDPCVYGLHPYWQDMICFRGWAKPLCPPPATQPHQTQSSSEPGL